MSSHEPLPGFGGASASTEAPLEMLAACHGRIEQQCATLLRLLPHAQQHGADPQARQAATAVMRYFDTAAVHHHADEEVDLFPALCESMAGSDATCIQTLVASLSADHRALEAHWQRLRAQLTRLVEGDASALSNETTTGFVWAYRRHIEREDTELLPMATRLIGDEALRQVGAAMRERRGIAPV